MKMKISYFTLFLFLLTLSSCLDLDEEPVLMVYPAATISAHVKDQKIFATSLINVNPDIQVPGNIAVLFDYSGELAIYNSYNGTIIDVSSISGGGLSQTYTVSADTTGHERFVVIATGTIKAYSDLNNDGKIHSGNIISEGQFYQESQFIVSELVAEPSL
jgi:hypothetical protein